jgi:uncharacterized hydantoinase/oxoprolinase family protein
MLTIQEIVSMAQYVHDQQIRQISEGLTQVYSYTKSLAQRQVPVIVTGLGKNFLARKAAEKLGVDSIVDLDGVLPGKAVLATPAFAVALMTAAKLEGENPK